MTSATDTDYGPTLPELIRPQWRRAGRWGKAIVLIVVLALTAGVVAYYQSRVDPVEVVNHRGGGVPDFTFRYGADDVRRLEPRGRELVRLESGRNGVLSQRMVISPLDIDDRPGTISARLPLDAASFIERAAERYRGFRLVMEGRMRLNGIEAYQIVFTAQYQGPDRVERQLFGKIVLLPEMIERPERGLTIELLATTLSPISDPLAVGNRGVIKRPFRSLRYE